MNEDETKPVETNKNIIVIVVLTLAVNATIGVCTLSYCILTERKPDVGLFTAFVAIVNYILGVISGMLAKTSSTPTSPSMNVKLSNVPPETKSTGEITVPEQELKTKTT